LKNAIIERREKKKRKGKGGKNRREEKEGVKVFGLFIVKE
jgi:stalled ribosome alternative rescue factor ArfA